MEKPKQTYHRETETKNFLSSPQCWGGEALKEFNLRSFNVDFGNLMDRGAIEDHIGHMVLLCYSL